jgi:hypothetical protein
MSATVVEIQAEARKMSVDLDSTSLILRVRPEIAKALKTRESRPDRGTRATQAQKRHHPGRPRAPLGAVRHLLTLIGTLFCRNSGLFDFLRETYRGSSLKVTSTGTRTVAGFPSRPIAGFKTQPRTASSETRAKPSSTALTSLGFSTLPCLFTVIKTLTVPWIPFSRASPL